MHIRPWLLSLLFLLFAAACGPADPIGTEPGGINEDVPATQPAAPTETPEQDNALPHTQTPPPLPEAYPPPPTLPPMPPTPEGYPAPPAVVPLPETYPGNDPAPEGFVWMLMPLGEQCAEPGQNNYDDLQGAVAALTAAGLTVGDAEMANLIVCAACGCPTSAHFRVQVDATDAAAAESLGWVRE